jgi:hypothetical protein
VLAHTYIYIHAYIHGLQFEEKIKAAYTHTYIYPHTYIPKYIYTSIHGLQSEEKIKALEERIRSLEGELGMYVCTHACMYMCMHVCACMYEQRIRSLWENLVCMYVLMYVCICACMYEERIRSLEGELGMYVCTHACVYMCMHVRGDN